MIGESAYVEFRSGKGKGNSHSFCGQISIHLVNLFLVDLASNVSLEFEGGREDVVLNREGIVRHEHILGFFERVELVCRSKGQNLVVDSLLQLGALLSKKLVQRFAISVGCSPLRSR